MTAAMLLGYRLLALALTPVLLLLLAMRLVQGKEDPRRVLERLGWSRRRRPAGPLVWLHAASVGELNSLVPLLQVLCRSASDAEAHTDPAPAVLITTVT
ncbi:MAG: glycosyltransferase N-terminal domain-containing protein, partial [Cyanobium sp.]